MFAQEANMHENKYNNYRIPAGLLITFLEKALLLIHMEVHLNDVRLKFEFTKDPPRYRAMISKSASNPSLCSLPTIVT